MDIRTGSLVFGKTNEDQFELLEPIGNGQFGLVFKIKCLQNQQPYALKTIITGLLDSAALDALLNEGRLTMEIKHTNVLEVIYFHDGKLHGELPPYLIMELADGGTLKDLLNKQKSSNINFQENELAAMFTQLAEGMKAINDRLIHRDIKPDNILIKDKILKVSDFGLSKLVGEATRTLTFKGIQHVAYMAPEAWKLENNSIQMDIYSMDIVFYELATLAHPFQVSNSGDFFYNWQQAHLYQIPKSPNIINSSLSNQLAQMILKMISKKPSDRYSNWDEIISRLNNLSVETSEQAIIDVTSLINKAQKTYEEIQTFEAEEMAIKQQKQDLLNLVDFRFKELSDCLSKLIEQFNQECDISALTLSNHIKFNLRVLSTIGKELSLKIYPVEKRVT